MESIDVSKFFIDVDALPENGYGFVQLIFLGAVYGNILMYASNLISDGSELLLLVPSMAGLVGSVVLPVLGAVPDGAIVLFSGLGPNAAEELSVGIGALAGSTIMLLTIPWALSIFSGRVNINPVTGKPKYTVPKLIPADNKDFDLTGVLISPTTNKGAKIMMCTTIPYFFIQIPSFIIMFTAEANQGPDTAVWAIIAFFICVLIFLGYLWYQYAANGEEKERERIIEDVMIEAINSGKITLKGIMYAELKAFMSDEIDTYDGLAATGTGISYQAIMTPSSSRELNASRLPAETTSPAEKKSIARLKGVLRPFYRKYDADKSGYLEANELFAVFKDLGENVSCAEIMQLMDVNKNGYVCYDEFVNGVFKYVTSSAKHRNMAQIERINSLAVRALANDISPVASPITPGFDDVDEIEEYLEEEEEDDVPQDLTASTPEQQQIRVQRRAAYMLGLGTLIVLLISDPMVAVLSQVGKRTGISAFYISFIFAPLASNASEVIAAYKYSSKKTAQSISISLSTLQGACIMNNSFVLGIFMLIIFSQKLAWVYFAETTSILFVILSMGYMGLHTTHTLTHAILILSLYPISLLLVAFLESLGFD